MQLCEELKVYPSAGFLLPFPATGMWKHALDHGFIKSPEQFLLDMTERQDFIVNMTTMTDADFLETVTAGLAKLNEEFGSGLSKESLLKTGGEAKHSKHQASRVIRNRNTNDSLNYATVAGAV
jgi:hypothetical protein